MNYIFILIIGSLLGGFLTVLIPRFGNWKEILFDRSRCDVCRKIIPLHKVLPIFGFIFSKGKCNGCGARITTQYLMIELLSGLYFFGIYFFYGLNAYSISLAIFGLVFLAIAWYDFRTMRIPDSLSLVLLLLAVIVALLSPLSMQEHMFGAVVGGGFFLIQFLLFRNKIGAGDISIGFILGLTLGFPMVIIALSVTYLMACLVAIVMLITRKIGFNSRLPLIPFLGFGTLITLILHEFFSWIISNYT